jgi:hypothetical protein
MRNRDPRVALVRALAPTILVAGWLVGCASSGPPQSQPTGSAGACEGCSSNAGATGTAGTGSSATGTGGINGSGGTFPMTGAAGTGSSFSDGGVSDGGGFDASGDPIGMGAGGTTGAAGAGPSDGGISGCQVQLYRVLPNVLGAASAETDVPLSSVSGLESGSVLRLRARAEGFTGVPVWDDWIVELEGAPPGSPEVIVTPLDDTLAVVDISLSKPGVYNITARLEGASQCRPAFAHPSVRDRSAASFIFRVTPPPGSRLPTRELPMLLADASRAVRTLDLGMGGAGQVLSIAPVDERGQPLPSFVRVSGPSFGFDLSGYTGAGPVVATLESTLAYELLIIPEVNLAPVLVRGSGSPQFFDGRMAIAPGVVVHGEARDGSGRAVEGARVLLRADTGRPSTIGVSGVNGAFSLQTRDGILSATIVPPPGSGLPEARVPVSPGIVLVPGVRDLELSMTWAASGKSAPLAVVVRDKGVLVEGARVRADLVGELPSVGQVRVKAGGVVGATDMYFTARGTARAESVSDAQGTARLGLLPTGRYRVTVSPPPGASAAITSTDVDLQGAGPSVTMTLAPLVKVMGTLLSGSDGAGVRVTALDAGVLAPLSPTVATADASGKYELMLSPGRSYELVAEPGGGKRWQRIAVARLTVTPNGDPWTHTLPGGVSWSGIVTGGGRRVAGALVQVFCVAPPASCVDATIPLAEGVTRPDGTLALTLPNFAP